MVYLEPTALSFVAGGAVIVLGIILPLAVMVSSTATMATAVWLGFLVEQPLTQRFLVCDLCYC
jgi:hypothetical protein